LRTSRVHLELALLRKVAVLASSDERKDALKPPRLRAGDRVRFVSPASTPEREKVARGAEILTGWGLSVEIGVHAFDTMGHFLAGRDEDRLSDMNEALRDPGVRAVFSTTGGKGAYRIADALDFDAARRDPKPLVGFSDITILHLVRWQRCRAAGFHGPHVAWSDEYYGHAAADQLRRALMEPESLTIHQDASDATAKVVVEGTATGVLMGGNLSMIGTAVGWACPNFAGAILLIEDVDKPIGRIDSTITQLLRSGCLDGLKGVAVGQFIRSAEEKSGKWSIVDVLRNQLSPLGVPVLGGLPIGHGPHPPTVPLGTGARIDTGTRTLTVEAGVR
jgi:muramoyltetrapeptide carboxypeptidase